MKKAVVAGGLGVIGRHLVEHLARLDDWEVVGPWRRSPDFCSRAQFIWVDLLDRADCERKLANLTDVTHLFSRRTKTAPLQLELVWTQPGNAAQPGRRARTTRRLHRADRSVPGSQTYGVHLGPFKTPALEKDPRHAAQLLVRRGGLLTVKKNAWTVLRPDVVCGFASGNPMNLAMVMAVYAAISKELGLPLRFPGKPGAYAALAQVTDAGLLARATTWATTEPK
jgi:hypothetical protein